MKTTRNKSPNDRAEDSYEFIHQRRPAHTLKTTGT